MLFLTGSNYNQKRLIEKGNKIILLPKGKEFNDKKFKYDIFVIDNVDILGDKIKNGK